MRQLACPELVEDVLACSVAQGVVMYPKPLNKREAGSYTEPFKALKPQPSNPAPYKP